jgi:hypothetical protein
LIEVNRKTVSGVSRNKTKVIKTKNLQQPKTRSALALGTSDESLKAVFAAISVLSVKVLFQPFKLSTTVLEA